MKSYQRKGVSCPHVRMSNRSHVLHGVSCPYALMYKSPPKKRGRSAGMTRFCLKSACACTTQFASRHVWQVPRTQCLNICVPCPLSIIKQKACRARTCSCQAKATSRRVMPAGSTQKQRWRSVGMAHICSNIACGGAHRHGTPCLCWL